MQNKTIKLGESDIELLQRKASEECCSASEVMRRALREYCGGDTAGGAGDAPSWVVDLLRDEIAELRRQLDQSQQLQLHQLAAFQRALPAGKAKKAGKKAKKGKKARKGMER